MAGFVKDLPQNAATGASETVPWATTGTTLAPSLGEQETGWQPQAVAGPPDYRIENYARKTQSDLNFRANQAALFLEYALAEVSVGGVAPGVNIRSITIAGNTVTYTDQPGDTEATVKDGFAALINADLAILGDATASHANPLSPLQILGVNPGANIPVTVAVVAGAGTITVSGPTDAIMRGADSAWYNADLVIGAPELNGDGDPNHYARVLFDKANAAFRAGKSTGTEWDAGNRGTGSIAMGIDCIADSNSTVAIGEDAEALANYAVALGFSSQASAVGAVAISASVASGSNSLAMMSGTATKSDAIAIGNSSQATQTNAVAIGHSAIVNSEGVAIGSNTTMAATGGTAIGKRAEVSLGADGGVAIGYAPLGFSTNASKKGAVALGYSETAVLQYIAADGAHSFAHGDCSKAAEQFSRATGYGALASNAGEIAHAAYMYSSGPGYHQHGTLTFQARGVGAGGKILCTDSVTGGGSTWAVQLATNYAVRVLCIARDGTDYAMWDASGLIWYNVGTVTLAGGIAGAVALGTHSAGAAGWSLTFTVVANKVVITGVGSGASTDFTCRIDYVQVKH